MTSQPRNGAAIEPELTDERIAELHREAQDQGVSGVAPSLYFARAIERAAIATHVAKAPAAGEVAWEEFDAWYSGVFMEAQTCRPQDVRLNAGSMRDAFNAGRASLASTPAAGGEMALPLMRAAFRTSYSYGAGGPFAMEFKFPNLEALHAADDEWMAMTGSGSVPSSSGSASGVPSSSDGLTGSPVLSDDSLTGSGAGAMSTLKSGNEASTPVGEPAGLSVAQEPKYTVNGSAIVNRASGEVIPADEPVFIFRARDRHALKALREYADWLPLQSDHRQAVIARHCDFDRFAFEHPERMKEPDTAPAVAEPAHVAKEAQGAVAWKYRHACELARHPSEWGTTGWMVTLDIERDRKHPSGTSDWPRLEIVPLYATPPAPASPAEPSERPGPSGDTPSDFQEGQWWLKKLDDVAACGTDDFKRAVAVVRNMMRTMHAQVANPNPNTPAPVAVTREPLSLPAIREIWDTHVGEPTARYPLGFDDFVNFAHAIERHHGIAASPAGAEGAGS